MQKKFIEKYTKFWWIFVSFRTFNWKGSWKMASFVSFLKAAFIPSVKAQEEIVNPQDALKVTTKSPVSPNWYLKTFSLFDKSSHLEVMSLLYITFDINFSRPSRSGTMCRKTKNCWSLWKIPNLQWPSQFTKADRRNLRRGIIRLHGCIEWLCSRNFVR